MSVIIGHCRGERAILAADGLRCNSDDLIFRATQSKLWTNTRLAVGFTGAGELLAKLRGCDDLVPEGDACDWMRRAFVPRMQALCDDAFRATAQGLVVIGLQLFYVLLKTEQVLEPRCGFHAIGSGAPYALGALHALPIPRGLEIKKVVEVVDQALAAAAACCCSVGPPYEWQMAAGVPNPDEA